MATIEARASQRGVFAATSITRFSDLLDGLSTSIAAGEIVTDLGKNDFRTQPALAGLGGTRFGDRMVTSGDTLSCQQYVDSTTAFQWDPLTSLSYVPKHDAVSEYRRGSCWANGLLMHSSFMTILPPNRELCLVSNTTIDFHWASGIAPPGSRHQGGCHILMTDGAVKFVTDSIEAGNERSAQVSLAPGGLAAGTESPFGLWGALGTRASRETIDSEF